MSERPGRRSRRQRSAKPVRPALEQLPWGQLRYVDPPTEPLDAEGLERVHDTAMRILEEVGIDFLNEEARAVLKAAGCEVSVDDARVKMDRSFVMEQVAQAPAEFTITPRNPQHRIRIGGDTVAFGPVGSPPNVTDLDRGRRVGGGDAARRPPPEC